MRCAGFSICLLFILFPALKAGAAETASYRPDTAFINHHNRLALQAIIDGKYDAALGYTRKAMQAAASIQFRSGLAQAHNHLGMIYRNRGNNEKALENYLIALKLCEAIGDEKRIAYLHHNIARIYDNLGDYPAALDYFFESLKAKEKTGDQRGIANTLGHIGDIYSSMGSSEAIRYYQRSLKMQKEIPNYPGIAIAYNQLGMAEEAAHRYQQAENYFLGSLEVSRRATYRPEIAKAYHHLGNIFQATHKDHEALAYYKDALQLAREMHNKEEESAVLISLGRFYLGHKNHRLALDYFEKGKAAADSSGVLNRIKDVYEHLSQAYAAVNEPAKAFYYYKFYIAIRDSIYNYKKRVAAVSTQLKYEYEKKTIEATLKIHEAKKLTEARLRQERVQHYALTVSLVLILLVGVIIFQRFRHRQKLKEHRLRDKLASDLHDDIGSALSSISMFSGAVRMNMEPGQAEATMKRIEETSRETIESIHDIVWSIQTGNHSLASVTERMEKFAGTLLAALNIDLKFTWNPALDLNLGMEQSRNLYLVFKEAVNNAAKYSNATRIEVEIGERAHRIYMQIKDNGQGFDVETADTGNGLYTMKQRANELNGTLEIVSGSETGTTILLVFKPI